MPGFDRTLGRRRRRLARPLPSRAQIGSVSGQRWPHLTRVPRSLGRFRPRSADTSKQLGRPRPDVARVSAILARIGPSSCEFRGSGFEFDWFEAMPKTPSTPCSIQTWVNLRRAMPWFYTWSLPGAARASQSASSRKSQPQETSRQQPRPSRSVLALRCRSLMAPTTHAKVK